MEPILRNPQFASLLRVWRFFTTYYDYLQLPESFGEISLYQFDEHMRNQNCLTTFISQLIKALVKKAQSHQKTKKNHSTTLYLAKNNKYNIFQDLLKYSYYDLAMSQVAFSLEWKNLPKISEGKQFQNLTLKEKYQYISTLTDLVSVSQSFKRDYFQHLKKNYETASEVQGANKTQLHKQYFSKMNSYLTLGRDSQGKCFFYISKIGDSILSFDTNKKVWERIKGKQSVLYQIVEALMKNQTNLRNQEVDLMENILQVWNRQGWKTQNTAFNQNHRIFEISQNNLQPNKLKILKDIMHQLETQYSKFISDCYNFRWGTKQRRLQYHKEINEAVQALDLMVCFSSFWNQTKHIVHKKLKTLDFYDYHLSTDDVDHAQFKPIFLRMNYLYMKGVISQNQNSKQFSVNLYNIIKFILQDFQKHSSSLYEYLMIFTLSLLGIVKQLYPQHYIKRLKYLQKEADRIKQLQKKETQQQNCEQVAKVKSKLRKATGKNQITIQMSSDQDQDEVDESQTTIQKKNHSRKAQKLNIGRRLRQKVKINYKTTNTNSNSKLKSKSITNRTRLTKLPKTSKSGMRNHSVRGFQGKGSKMRLDSSDSEQQGAYEEQQGSYESNSESNSDTEQKSNGLTLDDFKYSQDEETNKFRKQLRSQKQKN